MQRLMTFNADMTSKSRVKLDEIGWISSDDFVGLFIPDSLQGGAPVINGL